MYRVTEAAAAIDPHRKGKRAAVFRNWFARGILQYSEADGDSPPAGTGTPGLVNRHTLIVMAIASDLSDLGVSPKEAVRLARHFFSASYSSDGKIVRQPGGNLFKDGDTILFAWHVEEDKYNFKIVNIDKDKPNSYRISISSLSSPAPRTVINVNCNRIINDLNWLLSRPF